MQISDKKKKEILIKGFELLKDADDEDTWEKLAAGIGKMFSIDRDIAIDMWQYLLQKHKTRIHSGDANYRLIYSVWQKASEGIEKTELSDLVLNNIALKQMIFSEDTGRYFSNSSTPYVVCDIVQSLMESSRLQEANDCLNLFYVNKHRESPWYDVMDGIIGYGLSDYIDDNLYELLEIWCEKVDTEEDKAKLELKLIEYIE